MYGLEDYYSFDSDPVDLSVDPSDGDFDESDFPNAIIDIAGTWTFYPSIAYGGFGSPFQVVYAWEEPATGCIGRASKTVFIVEEDIEIQVVDPKPAKMRYCFNDDTITILGINNLSKDTGSFSIEGNEGLIDLGNNYAYLLPSVIQSGTRKVTYSVYFPVDGWKTGEKDFTFEKIEADFKWDNECFEGQSLVNFYDKSDGGGAVLDSHRWTFFFPEEPVFKSGDSIALTFDIMDTYPIEYIVGSENGCFDTINKDLILRPIIPVSDLPYEEDFAGGMSDWLDYAATEGGTNSWKFGRPQGEKFNAATGVKAWYTDVLDVLEEEQSYVISPCYDFTGSKRPMIKMDIWRAFSQFDGAVLQYTFDNGERWFEVGAIDDGIEWYNQYNIWGIPGGQGLGWSDKTDANWVESRHKLDMLENKDVVRFRIAYGAPDGYPSERDGIAFDNIWIGERSKKVLVEHFTNAGDTLCKRINEEFNEVINTNLEDIIDIQYHMSYPGADTFYVLNPGTSDTREYYYSLPDIPYAFIDGGRNGADAFILNYREEQNELDEMDLTLTLAALADNLFQLDISTTVGNNSLSIDVDVKAVQDEEEKDLTLQVAVMERLIKDVVGENGETRFENVLRDMLPNAQGTSFNRSWTAGDQESLSFDWFYQDVFDHEELRVVAFIQDDATKEVYQAEIDNPFSLVSIEDNETGSGNRMNIYPNPAYDKAIVSFGKPLQKSAALQLIDYTGRIVYMDRLNGGEQLINLSLEGFDSGLYVVRVYDDKDLLYTEKLVVIDNK